MSNCLSMFGHFVGLVLKGLNHGYSYLFSLTIFSSSNNFNHSTFTILSIIFHRGKGNFKFQKQTLYLGETPSISIVDYFVANCEIIETEKFQIQEKHNLFTFLFEQNSPADNYMIKVNNRNIRKKCEICSKLSIVQNYLLLTLNIFYTLF